MRPKRQIILYCANEHRASLLRYVINQGRTYQAIVAGSPEALREAAHTASDLGCVLCLRDDAERKHELWAEGVAWARMLFIPVVEVRQKESLHAPLDGMEPLFTDSNREILATIKVTSARTRGPKTIKAA